MELYQPKKIPEDKWFRLQQSLLLWMANIRGGRDLLCIPQDYPKIIKITPNEVCGFLGADKKLAYLQSDFRTAPKWARVIRHRWQEFQEMASWFYEEDRALGFRQFFPVIGLVGQRFLTGTYYPDASPETNTTDGQIRRTVSSPGESWATIIVSDGTSANNDAASGAFIYIGSDTTGQNDKWIALRRSIFLFNTAGLTSSAIISATTLSLWGSTKSDIPGWTPDIDIYVSNPVSNIVLAAGDFDTIVGDSQTSGSITYANWSTTGYNVFTFSLTGRNNVSKTGISKFGSRNANYDVLGTPPTWSADKDSGISGYFADQTGIDNDPKLIVTYTLLTGQFLSSLKAIW